jgi:hypothetical protein
MDHMTSKNELPPDFGFLNLGFVRGIGAAIAVLHRSNADASIISEVVALLDEATVDRLCKLSSMDIGEALAKPETPH